MGEIHPVCRFVATVPPVPATWEPPEAPDRPSASFVKGPWDRVPTLGPLLLCDGSGPAEQPSLVRLCHDAAALYLRFECADRDAWSPFTQRDEPLWEAEAVELFLAPGGGLPKTYFEFQVSPRGVLFDARVDNPHGDRTGMVADAGWDAPAVAWAAGPLGTGAEDWWAALAVPWAALLPPGAPFPRVWRANLYRIERPRDGRPEFTAWCPPLTDPPDFHRPARFGVLRFG